MIVDVPDGVRCTVYFLPSHDVYTWDAVTLTGSVDFHLRRRLWWRAGRHRQLAVQSRPVLRSRPQRVGSPSTRWAMMLRWISEVPPAMVPEKLRA